MVGRTSLGGGLNIILTMRMQVSPGAGCRGVTVADVTRSALEAHLRCGRRRLRAAAAVHSGENDIFERIEQIIGAELGEITRTRLCHE